MIIGFTGTQGGMTKAQKYRLADELAGVQRVSGGDWSFHHGDCIGADEEAHVIAGSLGAEIWLHPPINDKKRAHCTPCKVRLAPMKYLHRNRAIAVACTVLIAAPKGPEELRSGTWSTVRYARQLKKTIRIIMPDGTVCSDPYSS